MIALKGDYWDFEISVTPNWFTGYDYRIEGEGFNWNSGPYVSQLEAWLDAEARIDEYYASIPPSGSMAFYYDSVEDMRKSPFGGWL